MRLPYTHRASVKYPGHGARGIQVYRLHSNGNPIDDHYHYYQRTADIAALASLSCLPGLIAVRHLQTVKKHATLQIKDTKNRHRDEEKDQGDDSPGLKKINLPVIPRCHQQNIDLLCLQNKGIRHT